MQDFLTESFDDSSLLTLPENETKTGAEGDA